MKFQIRKSALAFWVWLLAFFWRRQTLYGFGVLLIGGFLIFHLSILPIGVSDSEIETARSTSSYSEIASNPLSLPYKLTAFFLRTFSESPRVIRGLSIFVFGMCVVALYRILKRWYSDIIALFATLLFATNATVLSVARLGTPLVLLFTWSIVISILLWIQHGRSRRVAPFSLAVVAGALLYIPGALYFFILLSFLFANKFKNLYRKVKPSSFYFSIFLLLLLFTPLFLSFMQDISILREWLLLPESIVWADIPKNILRVPSAFIYRAPIDPLITVGRLPIFDVASGGLLLLGLYAYQKSIKLERTKIMILTTLFAVILGALGQVTAAIIILIPFAYVVIAGGICFILDQWYDIFPKNPYARSFGLILVVLMLSMSIYYQTTRFLTVWPNTPETRTEYNNSRLIQ